MTLPTFVYISDPTFHYCNYRIIKKKKNQLYLKRKSERFQKVLHELIHK